MAFHKIFVALDNSDQADSVFNQAIELAHREQSELMLFSCVEWAPSLYQDAGIGLGMIPEQNFSGLDLETTQINLKKMQERLQEYQKQAEASQLKISIACHAGDPGPLICKSAKAWGAELIMVGRRGRTGLAELMLGSVSSYVLHRANCSVLVIQGNVASATA